MFRNATIGLAMATGLFSGCNHSDSNSIKYRATKYMQNKPKMELKEIITPIDQSYTYGCHHAQVQSKLDSVAFKDVFEATNALKDSSLIAEFNQISKKAIPPTINESTMKLKNNLQNTRIRIRDYVLISNTHSKILFCQGEKIASEYLQFMADSINYQNFFEKNKLFDTKTKKLFHKISQKIKP